MITLFSTAMLATSISNAQQFNQVRAYLAPMAQQNSYFPSEKQIQQALSAQAIQQESSFPPLEQQPQVFINQFSTPDVPRARQASQFVTPMQSFSNIPINTNPMGQRYNSAKTTGHRQQQTMKFPGRPRSANKARNDFSSGNSSNPFSFPNAFPAMPFSNNKGSNPITGWNNNAFPFMPNVTNTNRNKAWGDKRNIWPDFYTDFTDTAWDEAIGGPRKLGRMPGGWRFPYISTPDPVTVSDAITNQFPPIAEEAGHMVDISKWGVFNGQ